LKANEAAEERDLIERFLGGESWAFDEIMKRHQPRAYRIALGMLGDADEAADATQEAFVRAFRSLGNFQFESRFGTWLHRIVVNQCISRIRRAKLRRTLSLSEIPERLRSTFAGPARDLESRELGQRIGEAVAALPPRQRAVFVMRQDEGMSYAEISRILSRSEGAVRASYFQAIRKLRKELADHE